MSSKKKTHKSYEATAQEFADKVAGLAPHDFINKFAYLLPKNAYILDLGCGSGRDAHLLTEKGMRVLGVDFSANMIEIAQKKAPLASFQIMDIEKISFSSEEFDGVWAASSLHHIHKQKMPKMIKKIHYILKEGGYFYISIKKGNGEIIEEDKRYGAYEKYWSLHEEKELRKILEISGFTILDFSTVEGSHSYYTHPFFRVICKK
jgi:ubiquinone/menaquinone biosynthesis C-methylase UbiE